MDAGDIVRRANALDSQRKTLDNTYQLIEKYVRPFSGEFFRPMNSENEVDWRRRSIYDSTAIVAADLLAGQIHANLVSPAVKWFDFRYRDTGLVDNIEAQKYIDKLEDLVWFTLNESDFNKQVAEFLTDIVTYGIGIMFEEEIDEADWQGIDFTAIPVRDCYFEADAKDQPKRLYRRLQYTAYQLMDRFEMPADFMESHKDGGDVDRKYTVWFCVYPREEELKAWNAADIKPKRLAPNVRPWGYKYVLSEGDRSVGLDGSTLEEGGYFDMPAFRTIWKKVSGSKNGHSPAFIALSDILQLNQVVKQTSEAAAKAIDPAMITTERGVIGDVDLSAGGLTVVTDMDQLQVIETGTRFDVSEAEKFRLQTAIRSVFFIDKLELKESPAMTATEVNVRYERMMRQFASTLGRLQSDFLDKMLMKTIDILLRNEIMPPAPEGIDPQIDIAYTGPIPRAQQAEIANSIEQLMADYTALGEVFPELLDLVDTDKMGLEFARVRGVPTKILRNPDEVKQLRADRAAQEAQAMELAQAEQAGKAMQAVGQGAAAMEEQDVA